MMAAQVENTRRVHYAFKPSPYSSHSLVLNALRSEGGGERVLDLGCAHGELAGILSSRGYLVTGVERAGAVADDFPKTVELVEADLDEGLPPLGDRYDYVVLADVLEHVKHPEALLRAARGMLAPAGVLVASLPNSGNLYFRLNVLFGRFPRHDKGLFDRTHLHFFMWDGWRELFENAGFSIQDVGCSGIPVGLAFPSIAETRVVRSAERLCYDLARAWKRLFAYQFVVTARPRDQVTR